MEPRPRPERFPRRRPSPFKWQKADDGMALVITMLILFIVVVLITVIASDGIAALPVARTSQNYQAALQAADSGVEDFINRLDNNTTYYATTSDPTNPALENGSSWTTWATVPGTSSNEWYRYVINASTTAQTGVVNLTVTGAAGQYPTAGNKFSLRTIRVAVMLQGFTSFLYYTNYEIESPNISGLPTSCIFHAWEANGAGGYGPPSSCSSEIIYFVGNANETDGLNGPVFSNDALHICGNPAFPQGATSVYDQATTANVAGVSRYGGQGSYIPDASCTNAPTWYGVTDPTTLSPPKPKQPVGSTKSNFPTTNVGLANETTSSYNGGGCLYTGAISVTFSSTSTTSTMTVSTKVPAADGGGATGPTGVQCTGTNISLPPNGLLYDQSITSSTCSRSSYSSYCAANASVQGQVNSQVTLGSDNNITVTGNLTDYSTSGTDIIGLSAMQDIILNPSLSPGQSLTIDAAMVAVNDSIYLSNWASVAKYGNLNILGSMAQDFRGPVGTFNSNGIVSGFTKNYNYDSRLKYLQPPYFTTPTLPNWSKSAFTECTATATPATTTC